jgi:DNA mismatch repair protein MSH4
MWACLLPGAALPVRPEFTDTLAIKAIRHPIREKIYNNRFVPNDVYASQQSR